MCGFGNNGASRNPQFVPQRRYHTDEKGSRERD